MSPPDCPDAKVPDVLEHALFLVWGPPRKGPRSAVLARELGIRVVFTADSWRHGFRAQPMKYPLHLWRTMAAFVRHRPRLVFVQSPPTMAVWLAALYSGLRGGRFVIDHHSDAFERARWTRPRWLNHLVARRAAITFVTDEHWASRLRAEGVRVMVVPDAPTQHQPAPGRDPGLVDGSFNVAVVNTWAADEPLDALLRAARSMPEVNFHVTGSRERHEETVAGAAANVRFTGFLPQPEYIRLLGTADAVVCMTTRDHTMQRGACEALSVGTPIVTSDWPLLRSYFSKGAVHVDGTESGISAGIRRLMADHDGYVAEIRALREQRCAEWADRRREIQDIVLKHD
jgi:glycosyltransferase involved in cell wall biosynthesis